MNKQKLIKLVARIQFLEIQIRQYKNLEGEARRAVDYDIDDFDLTEEQLMEKITLQHEYLETKTQEERAKYFEWDKNVQFDMVIGHEVQKEQREKRQLLLENCKSFYGVKFDYEQLVKSIKNADDFVSLICSLDKETLKDIIK